ncbi:Two-component system response regulator [Rhodococcus sp. AW25M09]|uniref:ANTAR domain-containing protein n=1 Tax=Rhodococcus sp. AW25M09 TaxID=1268303 RepID=UPI0002AC3EEE|nr:ANTAR domain-containing protein [Rhodococcus sp. AW25M09]CCQ13567.1 Two-component system response regulator [Rhodococcus sp. AW25M09]
MNASHPQHSVLPDDVRTALGRRAPIEQAKGMLMATHSISADAAFALLIQLSQRSNRKLRDVAQDLVDEVSREHR